MFASLIDALAMDQSGSSAIDRRRKEDNR